ERDFVDSWNANVIHGTPDQVRSGRPAGAPLHDLLRAELASPRRHLTGPGGRPLTAAPGGHGIHADLGLVRVCREALAGPGTPVSATG
ncbi:hypothetical protein ABZ322_26155, partial [Streptomyces sp. NPDC006129]|uniref:hypothetical protein n=1 Tax=Streptomyces sp. NPDC006129 TaxID=3155348 RepID=UPI0033A9F3D9